MKEQENRVSPVDLEDDQIIKSVQKLINDPQNRRTLQEWIITRELHPDLPDEESKWMLLWSISPSSERGKESLKKRNFQKKLEGYISYLTKLKEESNQEQPDPSDPIEKWKQEFSRFHAQLDELYENPDYREKYVAMKDGKIIDTDDEELSLAARISKQFADDVVIVAKVTKDPPPVHEVPSPEFV